MTKKKYYGVAGRNGYGVYNNYGKVMADKTFVVGFKVKGFWDFAGAKRWAEEAYNEYQENEKYTYEIDEIVKINWYYYKQIV